MTDPYFKSATGTLYCDDCRKILRDIPDASVDLVFIDPPYNVGKDYDTTTDDNKDNRAYVDWLRSWFYECRRITKTCVVITPSITWVPEWVGQIERTHKIIAWVKENNCSRNYIGKTSGFQCYEPILVFGKAKKCILRDVYNIPIGIQVEAEGHPCPKPVKLLQRIVGDFTDKGDVVLDPFIGSGTTAVACEELERKWIGIDINPNYCDITVSRLSKWKGQQRFEVE